MRLFLGNLHWQATTEDLMNFIREAGLQFEDGVIVLEKETRKPRGFGFVEIASDRDENFILQLLNGRTLLGRQVVARPAHPRD